MNAASSRRCGASHASRVRWSWVPLSIPIFASQRPVSVISSSNSTQASLGICWSAADMRLAAW